MKCFESLVDLNYSLLLLVYVYDVTKSSLREWIVNISLALSMGPEPDVGVLVKRYQ